MATPNPVGTTIVNAVLLATALPMFWGGAGAWGALTVASPSPANAPQTASQRPQPQATRSAPAAALVRSLERLFVQPNPTPSQPQITQSSATRSGGKCALDEAEMTAIAPPGHYGLSLSDRPAITLQLPPTSAQSVALVFHNPTTGTYETAQFSLPPRVPQPLSSALHNAAQPQWLSFQLPFDRPGLTAHQPYRWSLVVVCGEAIGPDDPTFSGWIEYRPIAPSLASTLVDLSPRQRLRWYARQGYWYDMVPLTRSSLVPGQEVQAGV